MLTVTREHFTYKKKELNKFIMMNNLNSDLIHDDYLRKVSEGLVEFETNKAIETIIVDSMQLEAMIKESKLNNYVKDYLNNYLGKLGEIYDNLSSKLAYQMITDLSEIYY